MPWRGGDGFPEGGSSAASAKPNDAAVGGADIGFDARVVNFFESIARAADERDLAQFHFQGTDGRKIDLPEIDVGIEEGHAVSVAAGLRADVADDADFRFLVFFRPAKDEFLFGREFVAGEDAGAVTAEENGGGRLGKDTAVQVAPDEEDGDFLRNAAAAAHNLWWQGGGHRGAGGGPI